MVWSSGGGVRRCMCGAFTFSLSLKLKLKYDNFYNSWYFFLSNIYYSLIKKAFVESTLLHRISSIPPCASLQMSAVRLHPLQHFHWLRTFYSMTLIRLFAPKVHLTTLLCTRCIPKGTGRMELHSPLLCTPCFWYAVRSKLLVLCKARHFHW